MNFLPVADRELRLLVRQPRTYYARDLAALVVMVICLGMLYAGFGGLMSAASAGRGLFRLLSCIAAVYVLMDGPLRTADCLSQERREGTLGLLFLTDLRGYDVVLGKLISRVAHPAYCLLATLPALGIGLFLGGVTGRDFFCMMLALTNGLFVGAALAMCTSALCQNERWALNAAVAGLLGWAVLVPALGWGLAAYFKSPFIHPVFLVPTPAGAFLDALFYGQRGWGTGFPYGGSQPGPAVHLAAVHQRQPCSISLARVVPAPAGCRDGQLLPPPPLARSQPLPMGCRSARATWFGRLASLSGTGCSVAGGPGF